MQNPVVFDLKSAWKLGIPVYNAEILNALVVRINECGRAAITITATEMQAVPWAGSLINSANVKLQVVVRSEPLA